MKDAKGHGSNTRGGLTPVQAENAPFKSRLSKRAGHSYLDPKDPRGAQVDMTKFVADMRAGNKGEHASGTVSTPQLQRRHFEAIAAELKAAPDAGSPEHAQRVHDMAAKLATTNPGFRRDFFVAAATPGGTYRNKSAGRTSNMKAAKPFMGK